mgnify:CR=1 FL=1
MAETGYKPVPHDAAFRKALLAKPGVQKAFDDLEEEYTALHAMLEARQAAGLTQAEVAAAQMILAKAGKERQAEVAVEEEQAAVVAEEVVEQVQEQAAADTGHASEHDSA